MQTAEAAEREALAFYQQTILTAFRETNDALVGSIMKREESEAQTKRVAALREYSRLSCCRFDNGYEAIPSAVRGKGIVQCRADRSALAGGIAIRRS